MKGTHKNGKNKQVDKKKPPETTSTTTITTTEMIEMTLKEP